ncbi:MAG: nucleoside-diphosphate-sugar epimerase [Saprospiraceae bacterium]|jgi:nucleoside-diphosphate-sugar epimerase
MKVIITGSSGMVGRGVLLECLESDMIKTVLVVNRSPINMQHPKLKEVLLKDFTKVDTIKSELSGYDGCFYCMGISSIGINETDYTKITYDTVSAFANVLYELNPNLVFNYVSGVGTDSSEKGSTMWARVKGKTENLVLNKGFKNAFAFRPGAIIPEKGIQSKTAWYNTIYVIFRPFFPLFNKLKSVTTTTKIGYAMINTLNTSLKFKVLEPPAINKMAGL